MFFAPERFRERLRSVDAVTRETASLFQSIVEDMETRNENPERLARYLNQLGVLPLLGGCRPIARWSCSVASCANTTGIQLLFDRAIRNLFAQMATGGFSGADEIAQFNGDLFNVVDTVELSTVALATAGRGVRAKLAGHRAVDHSGRCSSGRWTHPERAQTGAHYTGADDIANKFGRQR